MTDAELQTLVDAGVLECIARHGPRTEYKLTATGMAMLRGRGPFPMRATKHNRPPWAYDCVYEEMPREPPILCVLDGGKK